MSQASSTFDFEAVAGRYDAWYDTPFGAACDALEKQALAAALPDPRRGTRLLEVGAGTGHWTRFFAERGFAVAAAEVSPAMLAVARGKNIAGAEFYAADALDLPYRDGSFDVAAAVTVLEFVRDPGRAVAEMARCVRTGGCLVVGALNRLSLVAGLRIRSGSRLWRAARFYTPAGLKRLLACHGRASVSTAVFLPPGWHPGKSAGLIEAAGRAFRLPFGAFIVGKAAL